MIFTFKQTYNRLHAYTSESLSANQNASTSRTGISKLRITLLSKPRANLEAPLPRQCIEMPRFRATCRFRGKSFQVVVWSGELVKTEVAMSTRVQWLGHACLLVESDGHRVLIDPFLTGNPTAAAKAEDVKADAILVSHGHGDHIGDAVAIAKRTGALVVANYEISEWLKTQGISNTHGQQHGGSHAFPFGRVKLTLAFHGSVLPDGSDGGNPCGFLIKFNDGKTVYDAADTGLFGDMRLIGEEGIDLAILPIGDNYTMGPDDALRAVKFLEPKKVLPIHYNTWDLIAQDAHDWATRVRKETKAEPIVLKPGEWLTV
jgi:L-ascorbate metabolism protein UlaG (beta-lactamase superfamily)